MAEARSAVREGRPDVSSDSMGVRLSGLLPGDVQPTGFFPSARNLQASSMTSRRFRLTPVHPGHGPLNMETAPRSVAWVSDPVGRAALLGGIRSRTHHAW